MLDLEGIMIIDCFRALVHTFFWSSVFVILFAM